MSGSRDDHLLIPAHWPWRVALFAALVVLLLGLEQLLQAWWLPSTAATLAVQQLSPSDQAAESLRTFAWTGNSLPIVVWVFVAGIGWALFVPMPRRWVRWLRHKFA